LDDGREIRRLTSHPGQDTFPAWTPDGKQVVFASDRGGRTNLWLTDVRGGKPRQLTDSPATDTAPCWSPDGKKIVFARDGKGNPHLCVSGADGSTLRALSADDGAVDLDPAWSPDGKSIAFASRRGSARGFRLYVMDTDGKNVRALSPTDNPLGHT